MSANADAEADARTNAAVLALVRSSLGLWQIDATVTAPLGTVAVIAAADRQIVIARAPPAIPFRWLVTVGIRERPASSVAGLLRIVRQNLDAGWQPGRARVVPVAVP